MSLVDDIATFLDASSTAFTLLSGTAGNLAKMIGLDHQHAGNTMAVLYETPGANSEYSFSTSTGAANVVFERQSFQILSRSTAWTTARSQAQTAHALLDGLASRNLPTATGTRYLQITAVQPPFFLQRDENDRFIASANYDVWRET
jgi:Bacteriophage minor capsid protein